MFCPKCGAKALAGADFCQKCGAKLIVDAPAEQPAAAPANNPAQRSNPPPSSTRETAEASTGKKSKRPVVIGIIAAIFILAAAIVALNWEGEIDYISTVKAHQFFGSQGITLTCEEVMEGLLTSPVYTEREDDERHYVDITGDTRGTPVCPMTISIAVTITDDDHATITPKSIKIQDNTITKTNDIGKILLGMFTARQEGREDIADMLIALGYTPVTYYETYSNEDAGISFSYPDFWIMEDISTLPEDEQATTVVAFFHEVPYAEYFSYGMQVSKFSDRPEAVAPLYLPDDEFAANFSRTATVIETSLFEINGVTMRKVIFSEPGDNTDDLFWNSYIYAMGSDVYRVDFVRQCEVTESLDSYTAILNYVMSTFTVDPVYEDQVLLCGTPIQNLFEMTESEIQETFGEPDMYIGPSCFTYGEDDSLEYMSFWIDSNDYVNSIAATPDKLTYNGHTFNLTCGELEELLGSDIEGLGASGYETVIDDYLFTFYIPRDTDRVESVEISRANSINNAANSDLTYKGVSLTTWMGSPADIVYDTFGWPDYGTIINGDMYEGGEYFGYLAGSDSSISFIIDYRTDGIGWITGAAEAVECNGDTLDKTRSELINTLGMPDSEEIIEDELEGDSYYNMSYTINGFIVDIELPDEFGEATCFTISPQ